jgi:hypothetical protein
MSALCLLKQVDVFSIRNVISYGTVASSQLHIPVLPFACVEEHTVVLPAVLIPMLLSAVTGEKKDEWVARGSANAPLLLPTILLMQLATTVNFA